ncbi:MAG: hypothetical protein ACE14V_04550, partial [bacterium]
IVAWLVEHQTALEAQFVYNAWLDAKGNRDVVWNALLGWLAIYKTNESAGFITKYVAKQPDIPISTIKDILVWCCTFPRNEDILWRLTQLRKNLLVVEVEEEVLTTSEIILVNLLLPSSELDSITRGQITTLISYLVTLSNKNTSLIRERVDVLFIQWFKHPLSFGTDPLPHLNIQRKDFVLRFQEFVIIGILDINKDRDALRKFMIWLNAWDIKWKQRALPIIKNLKSRYPETELWDLVQFDK